MAWFGGRQAKDAGRITYSDRGGQYARDTLPARSKRTASQRQCVGEGPVQKLDLALDSGVSTQAA